MTDLTHARSSRIILGLLATVLAGCGIASDEPSALVRGERAPGAPVNSARGAEPARVEEYSASLSLAKSATLAEVRARHQGRDIQIASIDRRLGVPTLLWAKRAAISHDVESAALEHLTSLAEVYGLTAASLATVEVSFVHDTGRGAIIVKMIQRIDGVEVYGSSMQAVMDRDRQLIALSGNLRPAATITARHPRRPGSARSAVEHAIDDVTTHSAKVLRQQIRPVLFAYGPSLEPAHSVYFELQAEAGWSQAYSYVVAGDGRILARANRTFNDSFNYRVWADTTPPFRPLDSPQGDTSPNPLGVPGDTNAPFVPPVLVSMEGFNKNPDGGADPWLPADATVTTGNNVDVYADHAAPDGFGAGDVRADLTSARTFDHAFDPTADAVANDTQAKGSIVQAFYTLNWLHDYFYDSGFNEASGVAQSDNFGRGGLEGDPLVFEVQDSKGVDRNNASIGVPPDGISPHAEFLVWDVAEGPTRGSSVANVVLAHEWGHYLHLRLASCESTLQCFAMSEGWGDFISMMLIVRDGDDLTGTYGVGSYLLDRPYFGIRRAPYSTNLDRNPFTFKHMGAGVELPTHAPLQEARTPANNEVHNAGEIWAMALTEVYFALLDDDRYTFEEAQRRMSDYVVAGLIATPAEATITEARDALLAAARATDTSDMLLLAKAFAKRGLGSGAISPERDDFELSGIVESFEVGADLNLVTSSPQTDNDCDSDTHWDAGETAKLEFVVANRGPQSISGTNVVVVADSPAVSFPNGSSLSVADIEPFGQAKLVVDALVSADLTEPQTVEIAITAENSAALTPTISVKQNVRINIDDAPASSSGDDFESTIDVWAVEAANSEPGDGWERITGSENTVWSAPVPVFAGDFRLSSPPLEVGDDNLVLAFDHRYSLIGDSEFGFFDGGLVEFSADGGATWEELTLPDYDGAIADSDSVLFQRQAFGGKSEGYPSFTSVEVDLGTGFAGKTIAVRFRLGAAGFGQAPGWQVDNVRFEGLANTPFPSLDEDAGGCSEEEGPIDGSGCGCEGGGQRNGAGALFVFATIVLFFRRKRNVGKSKRVSR